MTAFRLSCIVAVCTTFVTAEWYTSFSHALDLLETESELLHALDQYIENEQERIDYLRFLHEKMTEESCDRGPDARKCMGNPTRQYALMKRLASSWDDISAAAANSNMTDRFLWAMERTKPYLSTHEDVEGSINGLVRVQLTYGFSASDIALGIIGESVFGTALSARDCYQIAYRMYSASRFGVCLEWMVVAKRLVSKSDNSIPLENVLYLHARCAYDLGNLHLALETVHEIARIAPDFVEVAQFYRAVVDAAKHERIPYRGDFSSVFDKYAAVKAPSSFSRYEKLCQKHNVVESDGLEKLRCFLWNGNGNPRLLLQPIKVEVVSERPMMYRFHDFVSDNEIEQVKAVAKPLLHRAAVTGQNGSSVVTDYRVTKTAFVEDSRVLELWRIQRRIEDATGFDMRYSEGVSITNYGVGGHYSEHFDSFGKEQKDNKDVGDRVATVLLYLSDVSLGGNTVFSSAGIAVRPQKGTALMWYNLLTNKTTDKMSYHAGCPVAVGEKWIFNKWIREKALSTCAPCNSGSCPEPRHRLPLGDEMPRRT